MDGWINIIQFIDWHRLLTVIMINDVYSTSWAKQKKKSIM